MNQVSLVEEITNLLLTHSNLKQELLEAKNNLTELTHKNKNLREETERLTGYLQKIKNNSYTNPASRSWAEEALSTYREW